MSSSDKVVGSTPCIDSGSLLKLWFNPGKIFRTPNRKLPNKGTVTVVGSGVCVEGDVNAFVKAGMKKLVYLSYRSCFPKLPNGSTTDARWGCLIRTTQMLCATALLRYHSGGAVSIPEAGLAELKRNVVAPLFKDLPSAPLGIHAAEKVAHKNGGKYASMLSPTEAAVALGGALADYHDAGGDVPFTFCCADRNIDVPAVRQKLSDANQHVLLLIPVVLGIAPISEKYQAMMLRFLGMRAACGIAGGYDEASLYMFGYQGSSVFFLDPHYIQRAYTTDKHAGSLTGARGNLATRVFDPCMVLGFYLHTADDFDIFLKELAAINSLVAFPLISIAHKAKEGVAAAAPAAARAVEAEQGRGEAVGQGGVDDAPLAANPLSRHSATGAMSPA